MKLAPRVHEVAPFYVMEVVKKADELAASGRSIIHLSIGEPDFPTPEPVQRAACAAINAGRTGYTAALGLPALRAAIAADYAQRFDVAVDPARIVVTAGASAALALALAALVDAEREILLPDPSYPCNRNFAAAFGARVRLLPCGPENAFQPTAAQVAAAWSAQSAALLLASPANPTGTSVSRGQLADIAEIVAARDGALLVDEIYHGLSLWPPGVDGPVGRAAGHRPQQLFEVLQHDGVAPRVAGGAAGDRAGARTPGTEPLHLRADHRAVRGTGMLHARDAGHLRAAARGVPAPARTAAAGAAQPWLPHPCRAGRGFLHLRRHLGTGGRQLVSSASMYWRRPVCASCPAATSAAPRPSASCACPMPLRWPPSTRP